MEAFVTKQAKYLEALKKPFTNFKKLGKDKMTLGVNLTRVTKVTDLWAEIQQNEKDLIDSNVANLTHEYFQPDGLRDQLEEIYLQELGKFKDHQLSFQPYDPRSSMLVPGSMDRTPSVSVIEPTLAKLAPIQIPKFDGNPQEWSRFRDIFKSTVVDATAYNDAIKFYYLQSHLTGDAAMIVEGIPLEAKNFNEAWKALKNAYDNKRRQVDAHLKSLFSLPAVTKESSAELRSLLSGTRNAVIAMRALERPVQHWDDVLVYITINKTDKETRKQWEMSRGESNTPSTFEGLVKFLQTRISTLTSLEGSSDIKLPHAAKKDGQGQNKSPSQPSNNKAKATHATTKQKTPPKCKGCQLPHWLDQCAEFIGKSVDERRNFVKSLHLCFNCLNNHKFADCRNKNGCKLCNQKHHTLLHMVKINADNTSNVETVNNAAASNSANLSNGSQRLGVHNCNLKEPQEGTVLLSTVWVFVTGPRGDRVLARALLDQCSQSSFITNSLCQRLSLPRHKVSASITTVGNDESNSMHCNTLTSFTIQPRFASNFELQISAFAIPKITSYKPVVTDTNLDCDNLKGLTLADPHLLQTAKIDLLLSSAVHAQVVENEIRKNTQGNLLATNTKFGWVISGVLGVPNNSGSPTVLHVAFAENLDQILERFWKQEEIPESKHELTEEESECEAHFQTTHYRNREGRFVVRLPFKSSLRGTQLGNSIPACKLMLVSLERKFASNPKLKSAYTEFMAEYENLGHMQKIDETFVFAKPNFYCLPHHGVVKESSTTTKLRTVFNGSFRTNSGFSLNDLLHTGANLLPDLSSLVLSWRKYKYAFIADIEKMYRQIELNKDDQHHQMILWRSSPDDKIDFYKLTTLTYGLNCSPFIANRVRLQLAHDEEPHFPLGSFILQNECYLDDVLSGADSLELALRKQKEVIDICKSGGFKLRKWIANDPALINSLSADLLAAETNVLLDKNSIFSVLGLSWNPVTDSFQFLINNDNDEVTWSKREVLSRIAQIYDPLGWLSPVIITAKIFMQRLWISKIDWDTPLSEVDCKHWLSWYSKLNCLSQIEIPRWCGYIKKGEYEIFGFADASQKAFSAVVYLRIKRESEITINMLTAKTKVSPIESVTIPRLELKAAVLLSELVNRQLPILNIDVLKIYLWSDSKDVLYWLQGDPKRWPTFVRNRCNLIKNLVPKAEWYHVRSADNPADSASRGMMPDALTDFKLWWEGPSWMKNPEIDFDLCKLPVSSVLNPDSETFVHVAAEVKSKKLLVSSSIISELIEYYSELDKLLSTVAYLLRLRDKLTAKLGKTSADYAQYPWYKLESTRLERLISPEERERARLVVVFCAQKDSFHDVLDAIAKNKWLTKKHPLKKLMPIVVDGLLRVGGRIQHSLLSFDQKFPLILAKDHPLTFKIIVHAHYKTLHGGVQLTLNTLRNDYWILNGRQVVKGCIHRCVPCQQYRAAPAYQLMGNLPKPRLTPSRPFTDSGVDCAGPYQVRKSPGRGSVSYKGYVVIFICLATKAVHLELVSDYTANAFLAAFRRFCSRRGHCANIYSDQGPNFVGAANDIRLLFEEASPFMQDVTHSLARDATQWHFIPAASAHHGGIWEAAVKSTKHHLKRVLGDATLTFEEFTTLLSQIEACLNSRPLTAISDDPDDLQALTPAHFLIQSNSFILPEPNLCEEKIPVGRRWTLLQQMLQQFWARWSIEYIQALQQRNRWTQVADNLNLGDLVLINDGKTAPAKWPLARVVKQCPGKDGLVRYVIVRTATGIFERPVQKLIPLRLEENR